MKVVIVPFEKFNARVEELGPKCEFVDIEVGKTTFVVLGDAEKNEMLIPHPFAERIIQEELFKVKQ